MSKGESADEGVRIPADPISATFGPNLLAAFGWALGAGLASLVYLILHFNDVELFLSLIASANRPSSASR